MDEESSATEQGAVIVEVQDGRWHVQLSNPQRRNAIDVPMREQLAGVLQEAATDAGCRVVVLSGVGGTFSAGGDLSTMTAEDAVVRRRMHGMADAVQRIVRCPRPVIAAVEGFAYGAGLSLVAACDHVVAARSARLCCPFSAVGLTADAGLHWSLPARVGAGRARTMIMLGEPLTAETAHAWGLVDTLVEDGNCIEQAFALAAALSRRAPLALAASKRVLADPAASLDTVLAAEATAQQELLGTADFAEGRAAFFAKRPPRFNGR